MSASIESKNNVYLAVAGAGKTTKILKDVLAKRLTRRVVIVTYTNKAVASIVEKFQEHNFGIIPSKVDVFTWYSFLYNECVLPYQKLLFTKIEIRGMIFEGMYRNTNKIPKTNSLRYTNKDGVLKANYASEFVVGCIGKGKNIIKRLAEIYEEIIIDEIQDMVGYDLEFLEEIMSYNDIKLTLVGDSRQATFSTNSLNKNKKFKGRNTIDYFKFLEKANKIKLVEMNECHRSNQDICTFADFMFPNLTKATSLMTNVTGHDGVFLIKKENADAYIRWLDDQDMKWQGLRYDKKTKSIYPAQNFGECKGMTFDRVVIFSNKPLEKYLETFSIESPSKYYVGLTRARYSVAIIVDKFPIRDCYQEEILDKISVMKFILK